VKKLLLACVVAVLSLSGLAAPQAGNGRDFITLWDEACSRPEVLAHIPAPLQPLFFNSDAFVKGVLYKACWTLHGDQVILVYPDGDQGQVPASAFKEAGV